MAELIKALPCGALLAWITALFIGHGGGMGGTLAIEQMQIMDQSFLHMLTTHLRVVGETT